MAGLTGRNQFEENEYWVYQQQRFEAALKFIEIRMIHGDGKATVGEAMDGAIELADALLADLESSRTKVNDGDYK